MASLLADPLDRNGVLAVVTERFVHNQIRPGGVFAWSPQQPTWRRLADGLPDDDLSGALVVDGTDPSVLYAGTHHHGVYRLRRAGGD